MKNLKSAIIWLITSAVIIKSTQLVTTFLIMRVIPPVEYGNAALALSILFAFQGVSSLGFDAALIQKKDSTHLFSAAWTLELIKSITLALIVFFLIPNILKFTKAADNAEYFYLVCIAIIIDGLKNTGIIVYRKNLDFKKQFFYEYIPVFIGSIYTLWAVSKNPSGLAVVEGFLVTRCLTLGLSYYMSKFRPSIVYNIGYFKELFGFGFWITLNSILAMTRTQGINILIPRYYGATSLGIYNRSQSFSEELFNQFSNLIWKLGFPLFSKDKESGSIIRRFMQFVIAMNLVLFPFVFMIYINSDTIISLYFKEEWHEMIPIIKLLSITSFSSFLSVPCGIYFQSIGRPKINTFMNIINVMIIGLLVLFVFSGSFISIVYAFMLSSWITSIIMFGTAAIQLKLNYKNLLLVLGPIILSSLLSILLYISFSMIVEEFLSDILISGFCAISYLLIMNLFRNKILKYLDDI